jgi:hypothetical protein
MSPRRVRFAMEGSNDTQQLAIIRPCEFTDEVTGDDVKISVSENYSTITINRRSYFFKRENGEFDGTATDYALRWPFVVYPFTSSSQE